MKPRATVLGAGNGGYALASDLALNGFDVILFELDRFKEHNLAPIEERGGLEREGMRPGFAEIDILTSDIEEALADTDVVNVTIPAFAHEEFIELAAPHLDGKIVLFFPLNFADVKLRRHIEEKGIEVDVVIGGGETMPYACRRMGRPAYIFVRWTFPKTRVSAYPTKEHGRVAEILERYPIGVEIVPSNLEVSMGYENPVGHIPMMILNAASIERTKGRWEIFYDTLVGGPEREGRPQRSQEKMKESIRKEQSEICRKLGFEFEANPFQGNLPSPAIPPSMETYWHMTDTLNYRYLTEDIPYGLVTWSSMGDLFGVPTPTMKACIQIASVLLDTDFWAEGMTVDKLGFGGCTSEDVVNYFI